MQQGHLHPGTLSLGFGGIRQDLDTVYRGTQALSNPEGRRTTQDGILLSADYGLTERVSLGLLVPYRISRSTGRVEGRVEGLGDVGLSARFALTDPHESLLRVTAVTTATVPTGEVATGFLDQNFILGVGAVALGGGLEVIRDWPSGGSLFFRALGSKPTGPSDRGIRFGGALSASGGYGRPFLRRGRVRWALSSAVSWIEPDVQGRTVVPNRGGRLMTATGGVGVPLGADSELLVGVQRLVAADLRGEQLAARWSSFLGFRWSPALK